MNTEKELKSCPEYNRKVVFSTKTGERNSEIKGARKVIGRIQAIPTADVVEVVRCKDCNYFSKATVNKKGFLICPASGMEITDNDFCSYGVKMDKE